MVVNASNMVNTSTKRALIATPSEECLDVFEMDKTRVIISDPHHKYMEVEQLYVSKSVLKSVMKDYAIWEKFQTLTVKSSKACYTLLCRSGNCAFLFYASGIGEYGMFEFKCHKRKYSPSEIKSDIKEDMGMNLTYIMCWRAKKQALEELRGKSAASYGKLPAYMHVLNTSYPSSHIRMKKNEDSEFLYIFIALNAFIQGFEHCRPFIVVDASYLRGLVTRTFVAACTIDGAGHRFPLTYSVLDSENDASWTWFFENLKEAYGKRRNMCVVSDRNAGIIKSVEAVDVRVKNYLELAGYDKWARSYASVHRGWTLTSNIAESINVAPVLAREPPLYDFLEEVRLMFGRWNCENRQQILYTFTDLIGKFQQILQQNEAEWQENTYAEMVKYIYKTVSDITLQKNTYAEMVIPSSEYIYTVHDKEKYFIVCLKEKKCSCNAFQLDEIPCVHTCAVLDSKNFKKGPYFFDLYKPKTMFRTYDLPV
ncbi:uncharacterized protein LOC124889748 [Capsicum annuum]|uniref:uncharacterized protein LOC124889748 n=1 Tax=Capsicum annuum TaxID=4072 RepID=UPI001FB0DD01|nr:uncharacterized protein LOC124889748 [Capsicum annuum]